MKLSACFNLFLGAALFLSDGVNARLSSSSPKVENAMRILKDKQRAKRDFMQAMAGDDADKARKLHAPTKLSQAQRYERLVNKLKKSSTPRKLQDNNGYYQYNGNQAQYNYDGQEQGQEQGQYNYDGQEQGQYNQNYQGQENGQGQYDQYGNYQGEGDMDGQYYNYENNGYQNDYGGYDMYEEYNAGDVGFAMENYAFKYAGCAAIKSYDEGNAYNNGEAMNTETYVVFRLCPQDKCNKYSMTGCGKNYGEYLIEMEVYLEAIMEYYDAKYEDYCEYCSACDPDTQSAAAEWLQQCYEEQEQDKQTQAWEQYYEAHNGDMSNYANYMQGNGWGQGAGNWGGNQGNYYVNNQQQQQNAEYAQQQQQQAGNGQYYQGQYQGQYYNGNNNQAANNGGRKLSNYGNNYNGAGAYSAYYNNNGGAQNNYQNNGQNQNGEEGEYQNGSYGYYNEQGEWTEIDVENQRGYWGADGQFYEYENNDNEDYCLNMLMTDEDLIAEYNCDDYVCGDYFTYCTDYYNGDDGDFDLRDYMQCAQSPNGNYYIAPHCGSNHYTISLGVFADGNCEQYVGSDVSLSTVLGTYVDSSELEFFPKECVSCAGAEENQNNNQVQEDGYYGEYAQNPSYSTDNTVVAMCMALYEASAQCNRNLNAFNQYDNQEDAQACNFIDNVLFGTYDEWGNIILDNGFDFSDWKNAAQYRRLRLAPGQVAGLVVSLLLVVGLTAAALIMQRSLAKKDAPWRPKRNNSMSGGSISRQNSGIVLGRSRSGPGSAPLI